MKLGEGQGDSRSTTVSRPNGRKRRSSLPCRPRSKETTCAVGAGRRRRERNRGRQPRTPHPRVGASPGERHRAPVPLQRRVAADSPQVGNADAESRLLPANVFRRDAPRPEVRGRKARLHVQLQSVDDGLEEPAVAQLGEQLSGDLQRIGRNRALCSTSRAIPFASVWWTRYGTTITGPPISCRPPQIEAISFFAPSARESRSRDEPLHRESGMSRTRTRTPMTPSRKRTESRMLFPLGRGGLAGGGSGGMGSSSGALLRPVRFRRRVNRGPVTPPERRRGDSGEKCDDLVAIPNRCRKVS